MLQALLAAYVVSDVFLIVFFRRHWDVYTLQFVSETNWRETGEFLRCFVLSPGTLVMLLPVAAFFAAERWAARRLGPWPLLPRRRWARRAWLCGVAVVAAHAVFFSPDYERNYRLVHKLPSPIKRCDVWEIMQSVLEYRQLERQYDRCSEVLNGYDEKATTAERQADFVLVIGESFNRHKSNLYDGPWDTNPLLRRRLRSGRLFVFNDAVAPSNGTSANFRYLLSMNGTRDSSKWCDVPLFPAILRRAGWNVVFYGNQFVVNTQLDEHDAAMGYLNLPSVARCLFDKRNTRTYRYDMGLVDDYAAHRAALERHGRNFVMFHLYGQHINACKRYPCGTGPFTPDDIGCGGMSRRQRDDIAHYLNATHYNDMVVDSIIRLFDGREAVVLYLADHGEEVHDFRCQYGRTDITTDDPRAMRVQTEVPFMVYLTPLYARRHPDVAARLARATGRRFMTDDLPQAVCDLLGVRSRYVKPSRSVFSDAYRAPRHRMVMRKIAYD